MKCGDLPAFANVNLAYAVGDLEADIISPYSDSTFRNGFGLDLHAVPAQVIHEMITDRKKKSIFRKRITARHSLHSILNAYGCFRADVQDVPGIFQPSESRNSQSAIFIEDVKRDNDPTWHHDFNNAQIDIFLANFEGLAGDCKTSIAANRALMNAVLLLNTDQSAELHPRGDESDGAFVEAARMIWRYYSNCDFSPVAREIAFKRLASAYEKIGGVVEIDWNQTNFAAISNRYCMHSRVPGEASREEYFKRIFLDAMHEVPLHKNGSPS